MQYLKFFGGDEERFANFIDEVGAILSAPSRDLDGTLVVAYPRWRVGRRLTNPDDAISFCVESLIGLPWPEGEPDDVLIDSTLLRVLVYGAGNSPPPLPVEYREMLDDEIAHARATYWRVRGGGAPNAST